MKFDQVHLVGLGGTGSYLAKPLTRLLKYHNQGTTNLHFWDKDLVEPHNLIRQDFSAEAVDQNKAEIMASELKSINPYIRVHTGWFVPDTLNEWLTQQPANNLLIVLTVDNDATRNAIIVELDAMPNQDFVLVLPGNGYDTGNTYWYGRQGSETAPVHPFDVADNWAFPQDGLPGDCAEEAKSTPQLITSNFSQALCSLEIVLGLLNDTPMPFKMDYSGPNFSIRAEGKPTYFPSLIKPEPVVVAAPAAPVVEPELPVVDLFC